MTDEDLISRLRVLRRTSLTFQTELRYRRVDVPLLAAIDEQMERGIATEPRCAHLRAAVDVLRESLITPRAELWGDAVRACDKLLDAIEGVLVHMR